MAEGPVVVPSRPGTAGPPGWERTASVQGAPPERVRPRRLHVHPPGRGPESNLRQRSAAGRATGSRSASSYRRSRGAHPRGPFGAKGASGQGAARGNDVGGTGPRARRPPGAGEPLDADDADGGRVGHRRGHPGVLRHPRPCPTGRGASRADAGRSAPCTWSWMCGSCGRCGHGCTGTTSASATPMTSSSCSTCSDSPLTELGRARARGSRGEKRRGPGSPGR